jgi:hypothetical protein
MKRLFPNGSPRYISLWELTQPWFPFVLKEKSTIYKKLQKFFYLTTVNISTVFLSFFIYKNAWDDGTVERD